MKYAFLPFVFVVAWVLFTSIARAGNEVQNGGSLVLVEGKEYSLADLHFSADSFSNYKIDARLEIELMVIRNTLKYFLGSDLTNVNGQEFFESEIFHRDVEFRFTHHLPATCSFVSRSNLPSILPENVFDVACTHGVITYINPELFQKLSHNPTLQAFVIIHERLHNFSPHQNYDIKMEFLSALTYLHEKLHLFEMYRRFVSNTTQESFDSKQLRCEFQIEDSTLQKLNAFTVRARQLAGTRDFAPRNLVFTKRGGIIETHHFIQHRVAINAVHSTELCIGNFVRFR